MVINEIQCFVYVILQEISLKYWDRVITVLFYRRPFGCRIDDPSEEKQLKKAIYIKAYVIVAFVSPYQLWNIQFFQYFL